MPDPMTGFRSPHVETYKAAATRRGLHLASWLKEAADTALRSEGFSTGSPDTQWALVSPAGEVLTTICGPRTQADERGTWWPIENRDAEGFDPALHWRLKPLPLRVDAEAGVVVREYPLTLKTLEAM